MTIESRYFDGQYFAQNPTWDREDAPWKASQVTTMLKKHNINPQSMCEVGCGSGDVLRCLHEIYPNTQLIGYDISPHVTQFWQNTSSCEHEKKKEEIIFKLGDFHTHNTDYYNILLMLDVFEHVPDPFTFLEQSHRHAHQFIFHIPLDLSASTVLRGNPLLNVRRRVGHLHFYTKDLALETLTDSGYNIIDWCYTGASLNKPNRSISTIVSHIPRYIAYAIHKDWGVRFLGGETLIVLAE